MTHASGQWTLGVLIGLPIGLFIVLALLIVAAVCTRHLITWNKRDSSDHLLLDNRWAMALWTAGSWCLPFIVLGIIGLAMWPWQAEYHQYRPVHGTVANISNRFVGGDHSTSQKFVVTLTSGSQQYGITDTRAALLKPGDPVSLRCIRVYEYGSNDAGYDCKWGQS